MSVLQVHLKVRKFAAEVEGGQLKPRAARHVPPSCQLGSRRTGHADPRARKRRAPREVRARARVPSKRAPLSWAGDAAARAGGRARGGARARLPPLATRPSSLPLPSPLPLRVHGQRAAEALPSARRTLRFPRLAPTCQARPLAVFPAARRLLQTPAYSANPAAVAAPAGTEASLQTPTRGPFPRKHFPLPFVLSAERQHPLPGSGAWTGWGRQKGGEVGDTQSAAAGEWVGRRTGRWEGAC